MRLIILLASLVFITGSYACFSQPTHSLSLPMIAWASFCGGSLATAGLFCFGYALFMEEPTE
jgi:multidrug transporter EmrE-like cation transporter